MSTNFAQRAKDIVKRGGDKKSILAQLDALRREQFEHELQLANGGQIQDIMGNVPQPQPSTTPYKFPGISRGFSDGGEVTMEREMSDGIKVEHEHKPTLDFIKKYHKENGKFPSISKVAKSIATDHLEDFKKNPNRQDESYYKGLIDNGLSDELSTYAYGGDIHPLDISDRALESIRQMANGGGIHPMNMPPSNPLEFGGSTAEIPLTIPTRYGKYHAQNPKRFDEYAWGGNYPIDHKYETGGQMDILDSLALQGGIGSPSQFRNGGEIIPNDSLKTFDFGGLEGQKQTRERNQNIHNNIINSPDSPMHEGGESWKDAYGRVIPTMQKLVEDAPANTTVVTHNSVFGLINLWDKQNRPSEFSKEEREKYTKQDDKFKTGDYFTIKGKNGPIHIVRHGETKDNVDGNFRSSKTELTENGLEQSRKLSKELGGYNIPQIITSPLDRTIKTSEIIMKGQSNKNNEYAEGGGLSRSEDYGSKKKPYPSVKSGDFAGDGRSYPIPTRADAVDALRLAGLHGRSDVKSKVYAKYPDLKKELGGRILSRYDQPDVRYFPDGGPVIPENDEAKAFFLNYLPSPKYKERIIGSGYSNPQQVISDRISSLMLQKPEYWNTEDNIKSQLRESLTGVTTSSSNSRTPMRPIVNYNQADRLGLKPRDIMAHEISHKIGSSEYSIPGETPMRSLLNNSDLKDLETRSASFRKIIGNREWTPEFSTKTKGITHESNGYELKSDIDALRYMLNRDKIYNAGTEDFSDQHLQKANDLYKNNYIYKRLRNNYSDDDMKYLMNKIAMNNHQSNIPQMIAAYGGNMNEYAKGGGIHINPENRGKFTATKERTGKTTEELTHSKNPLTRKRAIFAQNARKWHHAEGGELDIIRDQQVGNRFEVGGLLSPGNMRNIGGVVYGDGGDFEGLLNAVAEQESGGNYNISNKYTGAAGKYQIMPNNWSSWSKEAGLPGGAEMTPENQEKVARYKLKQYYDTYGPEGAAIAWYAGPGALNYSSEALNRRQGSSGQYPSINEYANSVMSKAGFTTVPSITGRSFLADPISQRNLDISNARYSPISNMPRNNVALPGSYQNVPNSEVVSYPSDIETIVSPRTSFVTDIKQPELRRSSLIDNAIQGNDENKFDWNSAMRYSPVAANLIAGLTARRGQPLPTNVSLPTISPQVISARQLSVSPIQQAIESQYRSNVGTLSGITGGSASVMRSGLSGLSLTGARGAGEALNDINSRNLMLQSEADRYNAQAATEAGRLNLEQANRSAEINRQAQIANQQDTAARDLIRRQSIMTALGQLGQIGKERSQENFIKMLYGYNPKTGKKINKKS